MVDSFLGEQPHFIECFGDEFFFTPVDIPIIFLGLSICAFLHSGLNAVDKVCFEPDLCADLCHVYGWTGKYSFLMYFRKYYDIMRCNLILSKNISINLYSSNYPICHYSSTENKQNYGEYFIRNKHWTLPFFHSRQ